MEITKDMLDKKICEFEYYHSKTMTYRGYIRKLEIEYGIEPKNLDAMTDEELNKYDDFLFELTLK